MAKPSEPEGIEAEGPAEFVGRVSLLHHGQKLPILDPEHHQGQENLAVCCASAQNCIKIHECEFLYLANCISSPDNRDFFA
jgi:hypothetical protein